MFYDNFLNLCQQNGISVYKATKDMGIGQATATRWKQGTATPKADTLQKIADYFGVTTDYLLTGETKKAPVSQLTEDEEMLEYLNELKNNPGMRILFSKAKGASKEDLEKVVKMIEIMRGDSINGGYYF